MATEKDVKKMKTLTPTENFIVKVELQRLWHLVIHITEHKTVP
jgi:hypothetical protein